MATIGLIFIVLLGFVLVGAIAYHLGYQDGAEDRVFGKMEDQPFSKIAKADHWLSN